MKTEPTTQLPAQPAVVLKRLVSWLDRNGLAAICIFNIAAVFATPKSQTLSAACGWLCALMLSLSIRMQKPANRKVSDEHRS
jgi:hypothetical protein